MCFCVSVREEREPKSEGEIGIVRVPVREEKKDLVSELERVFVCFSERGDIVRESKAKQCSVLKTMHCLIRPKNKFN